MDLPEPVKINHGWTRIPQSRDGWGKFEPMIGDRRMTNGFLDYEDENDDEEDKAR